MTEFAHSIVLFSGDDGLPLEFNIQNTVQKESLRAIIEHGGGLCTLSDDAIILVSPGTKVLNVDPSKKLISTKYIFDCVKENYLLDTDEYRIEINEMETSDFSDNSANLIENVANHKVDRKSSDNADNSIDILEINKSLSPKQICAESNHAFDFEDSENRNKFVITNKEIDPGCSHVEISLHSLETHIKLKASEKTKKTFAPCDNAVSDSLDLLDDTGNAEQHLLENEITKIRVNEGASSSKNMDAITNGRDSPVSAVIVSSSQPNEDALDQFDNIVLNKINENPVEKGEDSLSQSYTVSSSADAQVSPKEPSHHTSAEIFEGSSAAPDSASQTTERQQYIKNLEKEIEQILQKPSPKSIQDKIVLVKYICCVKKLAPAIVLQTLQNF